MIDIASICHGPWLFPSQRGKCLNAAEATESHKGCVCSGVSHMLWDPHLTGASLILVELGLIHEAATEF